MTFKFDLHIHSGYSKDSRMEVKKIIEIAKSRGLSGIAITDHNSVEGGFHGRKIEGDDFTVIQGEEVLTSRGEVLCLFLNDEIKTREFYEVVDEVHSQDGLCIAPHPFDFFRINRLKGIEKLYKNLDGIEVFNARCVFESCNIKALEFALEKKMFMTGGSDAHTYGEIGSAGVAVKDIEDIRKGKTEIFGNASGFFKLVKTNIYKSFGIEV